MNDESSWNGWCDEELANEFENWLDNTYSSTDYEVGYYDALVYLEGKKAAVEDFLYEKTGEFGKDALEKFIGKNDKKETSADSLDDYHVESRADSYLIMKGNKVVAQYQNYGNALRNLQKLRSGEKVLDR